MLELISFLVGLACLSGMAVIFFRKMPLLANLPKTTPVFALPPASFLNRFLGLKEKLAGLPLVKGFSPEILLQKTLSKIRVLMLRLERQVSHWLEILRLRAKQNHEQENNQALDDYWKNLQKPEKKE